MKWLSLALTAGLVLSGHSAMAESSATLTLCTYNLHVGVPMGKDIGVYKVVPADLDNQADTLRTIKPDLVALQEVDCEYGLTIPQRRRSSLLNQARYLAGALDMHYIFGSAQDDDRYPSDNAGYVEWGTAGHWTNNANPHGEVGNGVLSRFAVKGTPENIPLPKNEGQERRACIRAEFDVPASDTTRTVVLYATHLQHNDGPTRAQQMAAILHRAAAEPAGKLVFVMGDMNHQLEDPGEANPIKLALERGFHDLSAPKAGAAPAADDLTFPADKPDQRIDFVFSRDPLPVAKKIVYKSLASDHLPLAVTIEF